MLSYCLKCRKIQKVKYPKVKKIKSGRIMFLSNCTDCRSKNSRFIKEQEVAEKLRNLPEIKVPILGGFLIANILF